MSLKLLIDLYQGKESMFDRVCEMYHEVCHRCYAFMLSSFVTRCSTACMTTTLKCVKRHVMYSLFCYAIVIRATMYVRRENMRRIRVFHGNADHAYNRR
jgi:hypothetical protein